MKNALLTAAVLASVLGCSRQDGAGAVERVVEKSGKNVSQIDDAALRDSQQGGNWLAYGRNYYEQRYSPLDQINKATVGKLGLAWNLALPKDRSLMGTPIVIDGVMYFTGSWSVTRAVNARNGELIWEYDPKSIKHAGDRLRMMWDSSRGLAFWKDRVIIATIDGRLIALDAKSGRRIWETQATDINKPLIVTGHPKVFRDLVLIGDGGTEWSASRGVVKAFNVTDGSFAWQFFVVPGNPADGFEDEVQEMAAKTWTGEWWEHGGGGNVWNGLTYDPDFDQVLIGTGNGSPWNRRIRSPDGGDNLFLCSIVALDAKTGKYKWHYQTVPGETWDYNSSMDITLADLQIEGKPTKALLHAPKNGFFYVIDRKDGRLISADKIAKVTWATHVDLETGRPAEVKGQRYEDGPTAVWPGPLGAHNWHAQSYSPRTGLVYIPKQNVPAMFDDTGIKPLDWRSPNAYLDTGTNAPFTEDVPPNVATSSLLAWDPIAKKAAWEIPQREFWNAGTMVTAGDLVFQGGVTGDFVAFDAHTGEKVWSVNVGSGISAPPVTYEIDGVQYVSVLVGFGGSGMAVAGGTALSQFGWAYGAQERQLLTFALNGKKPMPNVGEPFFPAVLAPKDFKVDRAKAASGGRLYGKHCVTCHSSGAVSGGYAPDLRASPIMLSTEAMKAVIVDGAKREPNGMPSFPEFGTDELAELQHFVRAKALEAAAARPD